jgi:large subunit ribosomal protein L15
MKNLGNLRPALGSHKATKRIGRGIGSGTGKTAGKGHKGQKARKGGGIRPGFEGGQTPLYRRTPKHGFKHDVDRVVFSIISLQDLNLFDKDALVTKASLKEKGLIKKETQPIKILGNGVLEKRLTVKVDKITAGARRAIEQQGGKLEEA